MKLIHVALKTEAKPLIEYLKLPCIQAKPYKIYKKDNIVLIVSGLGKEKTLLHVEDIFQRYNFTQAVNIGIAGCKNKNIQIGEIFCCNKELDFIKNTTLTTVDKPLDSDTELNTTLVDMEASYFNQVAKKYLDEQNIYILKIVSDYLDITIPKKEFVWKIIEKNLKNISKVLNLTS